MGAFIKFTLAAVCAVLVVYAGVCVWSGRWPAFVTVRNGIEAADCAVAFDDGWTWNISMKPGEEKHWLFLLGEPNTATATCRTATKTFVAPHSFCPGSSSRLTVFIHVDPTVDGEAEAFCIVS